MNNATGLGFQSVDQLFTVIMHEAGHVFGLEHATNTASVMHPFAGVSALHTEDISGLQQIYGVRALDPYEEDEGNNSFDDATKIENSGSLKGSIPLVVYGDIHDQNDADYYFLKELSNYRGPISFRLISDGISLLKPTMTVFNEDGETVTQVSGSGNRGVDLTVTVSGADDEEFFVRVEGVDGSGLNQTGAYSLVATFDNNVSVDPERLEQVVREDYEFLDQDDVQELFMDPQTAFFKDDLHANDSFATSSELKTTPGYVEKTHFSIQASLSDSSDVDFYDFEVPEIAGSEHAVLTANLLSLTPSGLIPKLEVFDSSMNQIEHSVLVNGNGEFVVQSDQMESGEKYYVRVVANSPGNGFDTGNYDLQISFGQELLGMQDFGSGTLDDSNNTGHHTLYVAETQLFHFALAAADAVAATSPQAAIWMTIFDEDSNVVYRVATQPGETRTAKSVVLRPGSYSVQVFLALTPGSQPAGQPFSYSIQGNSVSEPTGPEIVDPSQMPFPPCNPNGPNFCYPNNNPSPNPFIFVNGEFVSTTGTTNPPYLDPNVWYWFNQWLTQNVPSSP